MPGFNPFRYRFPYTNINDINLDWIIKKVRKLSEDVAEINPERMEEVAQQAAAAEQTAQNALETAEGVSGIATDAESIARAAQTTANNAADSAQAAGTAAAAAQTTANNAADSAQAAGTAAAAAQTTANAAGTAAAAAQTTANNAADSAQAAGTAAAAAQTAADAAGTAATAAQTTANQNRVALAIVANGNTAPQNISAGQYVIWRGGLYTASAAIASGATLSGSNLTAVSGGGLNSVDFRQAKRLYSTNNLNDVHGTGASGLYYISSNVPNSPINYAMMLVISQDGEGYATQLVLGGSAYYREYAGSPPTWRSWKRLDNV